MAYSGLGTNAKGAKRETAKTYPLGQRVGHSSGQGTKQVTEQKQAKGGYQEAGFSQNSEPSQSMMRDAVEGFAQQGQSAKSSTGQDVKSLIGQAAQGDTRSFAQDDSRLSGQNGTDASHGVPESYHITFADGMCCDEELLAAATPILKEMKLNQEQAQKLAELHASHIRQVEQGYAQTIQEWRTAVQQDPELGGANFPKKLGTIAKAASTFGTKALLEILDSTGIGNHPEVLRFFYKVGCALEQDGFMTGAQATRSADPISLVYPKLKPY